MPKTSDWLACYFIWFALMVLAAFAAWRTHYAVIYLAELLVDSSWRPTDWHSGSVSQISRLSIFAMGSVWLIYVLWIEYVLRQSVFRKRLMHTSLLNIVTLLIIIGIAMGLLQL